MNKFKVGFIGVGNKKKQPDAMGFAMAYQHANAYKTLGNCELVACNDDLPARWVMGQIDYRTKKYIFGAAVENQAIGYWEYENSVFGLIAYVSHLSIDFVKTVL
jgi:hypothetical protein